jgi:hypothetical protein
MTRLRFPVSRWKEVALDDNAANRRMLAAQRQLFAENIPVITPEMMAELAGVTSKQALRFLNSLWNVEVLQ